MAIKNARIKYKEMHPGKDGEFYYTIGFECPPLGTVATKEMKFEMNEIRKILDAIDVRTWDDLPRKFARIEVDQDGNVSSIGHILYEKWTRL